MALTLEKHLAAILAAWNETDGYTITPELNEALKAAEADFDGVEADAPEIDFNAHSFRREVRPEDTVTYDDPRVASGPDYPSRVTQKVIDAYAAAWEAKRAEIGDEEAPPGTKTRAGLEAALEKLDEIAPDPYDGEFM